MASLKDVEKLNRVINKLFANLGYEELESFLSTDFGYFYEQEKISYTILEMPLSDAGFKIFINKHFSNIPQCSIFTLSLLHEIGHHVTIDDISDKMYNKCQEKKNLLARQEVKTPQEIIARQVKYCGIYDEKIATAEAINILLENYTIILDFEQEFFAQLNEFYLKNNVKNS